MSRATWRAWVRTAAFASGFASACSSSTPGAPVDTRTPFTREQLLDPLTCKQCHQQHYQEWSGSMHAYASTDPVFRAMNARGQKETNGALGDFCVKCHAPMAVREGATQDGLNLDADAGGVPDKLQGITCYFCHNVTDVTDSHNNPLVLANDTTMRGGVADPLKYYAHPSQYSTLHDSYQFKSAQLCGACHDIVVPGHFAGATTDAGAPTDVPLEQTYSEWKGSIFSTPASLGAQPCGGCHFKRDLGVPIADPHDPNVKMPVRQVRSNDGRRFARHEHTFPAVDTALVDFPERDTQLPLVTAQLNQELRMEICVVQPMQRIDVTLENLGAGHNFPSGASQDRRLWVEVHAFSNGKEVYTRGVVPSGTAATNIPGAPPCADVPPLSQVTQPCTWVLRDETFKADGKAPAFMFWDVAKVNQQTIPVFTPDPASGNQMRLYFRDTPTLLWDDIKIKVWLEPIGLDVIDDMIAHGYLDSSLRSAIPRFMLQLPSGNSDAGADPISLEWTPDKAGGQPKGDPSETAGCVQNTMPLYFGPAR